MVFLLLLPILLPILVAPIGVPIMGYCAIHRIRHSGGQLYGLPLALFDLLVFPLLFLDVLVGAGWYMLVQLTWPKSSAGDPAGLLDNIVGPLIATTALTVASVIAVDFLIIRKAWRAANKPLDIATPPPHPAPSSAPIPTAPRKSSSVAVILTVGLHLAAMVGVWVFFTVAVPHYAAIYKDFRSALPPLTMLTVQTSDLLQHWWFLAIPVALMLLAADAGICWLLDRAGWKPLRWIWSLLVLLALGGVVGLGAWGLEAPMRSLMLQLTYVPKPSPRSGEAAFGPVIERTVKEAADLDTGKLASVPEDVRQKIITPTVTYAMQWMESEGIDVFVDLQHHFFTIGMRAILQDKDAWTHLTPIKVAAVINASMTKPFTIIPWEPLDDGTIYVFQTREGGKGIMQVIGITDKGVKIQYKLVQQPVAQSSPPTVSVEAEPSVSSNVNLQHKPDPERVRRLYDIRNIVIDCMMYSTDHNGAWPDKLADLQPNLGEHLVAKFESGYVYQRPGTPQQIKQGDNVRLVYPPVVWERQPLSTQERLTGFMDGRAEGVNTITTQPAATPLAVKKEFNDVLIPDADTKNVPIILDLATGEMFRNPDKIDPLRFYTETGKGDLAFDNPNLVVFRGGKLLDAQRQPLPPRNVQADSSRYDAKALPQPVFVQTGDQRLFELHIVRPVNELLHLRYAAIQSATQPATQPADMSPTNIQPEDPNQTVAGLPPVVVRTDPASGARDVAPGVTEIRVTFSKEMADRSWSWSTAWADSTPAVIGQPLYEPDHRTATIKVKLEPGKTYGYWLNSENFHNFTDKTGHPAVPYLLIFQTQQTATSKE